MTNSSGQAKEFIWSNGILSIGFFDVNCILKYSKYRFSSSIPGMPGEAKISIPYSVWVEDLICIYIHIYMCCNVLGCSKCGGLHS